MDAAEFESVLRAAQSGGEWAWSQLYSWLAPELRGYLRARGAQDADDALGEVFVQLARNIGGFAGDAVGFRSWAFLVAHNRVIDQSRRRKADKSIATDPGLIPSIRSTLSVEAEVIESMSAPEMRAWLGEHLTEDQLDVVLLRVFGGFSAAEVAEALGKQPGAVRVSQHRALAALRKAAIGGRVTK